MIYDQLLAICDNYSFKDSTEPVKALRAVVELHKPRPNWLSTDLECPECRIDYPCKTIQAIEKELQ